MSYKNNKKSWGTFKDEMKAKRKKGTGGTKNEKSLLQKQELVVQRLSSEVSGKAQKYTRVGPREFIRYEEDELTIEGIKAACEQHFSPNLERNGLICDVLAGEQGPSCQSMNHIPDLKVIHVRFVKSSKSRGDLNDSDDGNSSTCSSAKFASSPWSPPRKQQRHEESVAKSLPIPKSLSVSHMLRIGKLKEPDLLDIYSFNVEDLSWSLLYRGAQFSIDKDALGKGGFREAFMAKCLSKEFDASDKWVVKRYLPEAVKEITEDINMSIEQHTKKVVQMHGLAKNFADQIQKKVKELKVEKDFGETLKYHNIYLAKRGEEFLTLEKFIEGKFEKYTNNTGEKHVPKEDPIGQKAECLTHFSYEVSESQIMLVDIQGSGHMLYDPEIASESLYHEKELLFCAGNLTKIAIGTFLDTHTCNKFCNLLGLKVLEKKNSLTSST